MIPLFGVASFPIPLPVNVTDFPGPDLYIKVSVAISVAALVVAVITLLRVNKQINIANKQLDYAEKELKAVQEDLDYNKEQLTEFRKRPNLEVSDTRLVRNPIIGADSPASYTIEFLVKNTGTRIASAIILEIFFQSNEIDGSRFRGETPQIRDGIKYEVAQIQVLARSILSPNASSTRVSRSFIVLPGVSSITVHYRLFDETTSYPMDQEFWKKTFTLT